MPMPEMAKAVRGDLWQVRSFLTGPHWTEDYLGIGVLCGSSLLSP